MDREKIRFDNSFAMPPLSDFMTLNQYISFLVFYPGKAIKQLWNLKDDVQRQVNAWIDTLGLEGTVCGFHVRRGDKVSGGTAEALKQDIPSYLIQAQRSGLKCDTCFFSSDDMSGVLEEVNSYLVCILVYIFFSHLTFPSSLPPFPPFRSINTYTTICPTVG